MSQRGNTLGTSGATRQSATTTVSSTHSIIAILSDSIANSSIQSVSGVSEGNAKCTQAASDTGSAQNRRSQKKTARRTVIDLPPGCLRPLVVYSDDSPQAGSWVEARTAADWVPETRLQEQYEAFTESMPQLTDYILDVHAHAPADPHFPQEQTMVRIHGHETVGQKGIRSFFL